MQKISQAAAAGGLVVSGAMMAIPGAVGIVVSNAGHIEPREGFAARSDRRPAHGHEPREDAGDGARPRHRGRSCCRTVNYSPLDMTSMVSSLEDRAGRRPRRIPATRRLRQPARRRGFQPPLYRNGRGLSPQDQIDRRASCRPPNFRSTRPRNGAVVGIWPVDAMSWTEAHSRAMSNAASAIRANRLGRPELRISGQATPRAKDGLRELGFTVAENTRR